MRRAPTEAQNAMPRPSARVLDGLRSPASDVLAFIKAMRYARGCTAGIDFADYVEALEARHADGCRVANQADPVTTASSAVPTASAVAGF